MRYKIIETNWPRILTRWPFQGNTYELDPDDRFKMEGYWHPLDRETVFSDIFARDGVARYLTIMPTASNVQMDAIRPLNRLAKSGIVEDKNELTPQIHRTYMTSSLYKNRMRRLKIGGVDLRLVLIALGILGLVLGLLYFSGYLGR